MPTKGVAVGRARGSLFLFCSPNLSAASETTETRDGAPSRDDAIDAPFLVANLVGMIRACPRCGIENRIPVAHLADRGRCGRCKSELPALSEPVEVGSSEFEEITANARVPVLVDFWAEWCGPCRVVAPEVKRTALELSGKAIVLKVNTDQHPDLARRFHIQGIPNFIVFHRGLPVHQQAGAVDHRVMRRWIEQVQSGNGMAS